ncbi:MAG: orotate phosphoribosyltransferase [Candidatus Margulisiibacteriota bacterium]
MYDQLKQLLKDTGAVKTGDFTLSSGKKSNFYVDGKQVTCHPLGLKLMADIILDKIKGMKVDAVGGLTIGADPIAAAVAIQSQGKIAAFIVRKEAKGHGLGKEIEGIIKPGWKVVVVDDVITTAGATLKAIAAVEKIGCKVVKVICLVDREEGGAEALKNSDFDPLFKKSELV